MIARLIKYVYDYVHLDLKLLSAMYKDAVVAGLVGATWTCYKYY